MSAILRSSNSISPETERIPTAPIHNPLKSTCSIKLKIASMQVM